MGLLIDPVQILQSKVMRIVWRTVRRITNEILGVKGLKELTKVELNVLLHSDSGRQGNKHVTLPRIS